MLDGTMFNKDKKYINANTGALILLVAIGADLLVVQFFLGTVISLMGLAENFYINMLLNVCIQISFVVVAFLFLRKKKLIYSPIPKDFSKKRIQSTFINTIIGITGILVSLICFYSLAVAFDLLLQFMGFNLDGMFEFESTAELLVVFFVVAVCAPIGEEILFRGVLLSGLKKSGYKNIACILLTGLAFSLMHMNPVQTVYQFCIGCAMGYITIKSNSLLPAIFMHAANNFFALLMEIVGITFLDDMALWIFSNACTAIVLTILLAVAGTVIIFYLGKLCGFITEKFHGKTDYNLDEETEEPTPTPTPIFAYPYYAPNNYHYGHNIYINNINNENPFPGYAPQAQHMQECDVPEQHILNAQNQNVPNVPLQSAPNQNIQGFSNQNTQYPSAPYYGHPHYPIYPPYTPYPSYPPYPYIPPHKRDPEGKKRFGLYYGLSLGACAIIWVGMLFMGILELL